MRPYCYVISTATKDWKPIQTLIVVETYDHLLDVLDQWGNDHGTRDGRIYNAEARDGRIYDAEDGGFLVEYPTPYGYNIHYVVERRPFYKG
jgi:hypothetical protein